MFLLLGSNTLVGQAFAAELQLRGASYVPLCHEQANYADVNILYNSVRRIKPAFILNAECMMDGANDELCVEDKARVLRANVLVPQAVARVCQMRNLPWGHISSGTIFRGAKVLQKGQWLTEIDLNLPEMRRLAQSSSPRLRGFAEGDEPNNCFVCPPCDFYSGTVALGEQAIRDVGYGFVWRPGALFLDQHHPLNLLSAIRTSRFAQDKRGPGKRDVGNVDPFGRFLSVTHLGEFARACLELWERRAEYGTYHIVNPGIVDTQALSARAIGKLDGNGSVPMRTPASNGSAQNPVAASFVLDTSKLSAAGVTLRPASEALLRSLEVLAGQHGETGTRSPQLSASAIR